MTKLKRPFTSPLLELVLIIAAAVGLAVLIQAWVVKPYKVPSGSMEPTLRVGQRILADRIGMHFATPHVGDIMVFHPPVDINGCADPSQGNPQGIGPLQACDLTGKRESGVTFVKRVVGMPGDHLRIVNGHVIRNGKAESAPYAVKCPNGNPSCNFPRTIIVPPGEYFMMGDNRPNSQDSRFWGPVPKSWLIGYVFFTYWPISRIGVT